TKSRRVARPPAFCLIAQGVLLRHVNAPLATWTRPGPWKPGWIIAVKPVLSDLLDTSGGTQGGIAAMSEQKSIYRGRTFLAGKVISDYGQSSIDCIVRRMSDVGATIEVENVLGISE